MAEEDKTQEVSGEQRFAGPGSFPCVPGGGPAAQKRTWPELVGLTGEEAEAKIKEEKPRATVHVVPQDSFVTMDYRLDRVRIFIDSDNKVVRAPTVG